MTQRGKYICVLSLADGQIVYCGTSEAKAAQVSVVGTTFSRGDTRSEATARCVMHFHRLNGDL